VNVQEDETPSGLPPQSPEHDPLAEPRARRGEAIGDPILIRRAETAEAAAQALEDRLARIQERLREAERESESASQRLGERERELERASQRLSDGEQQLHSVSGRLAEREQELQSVTQRLSERERELHSVSTRLEQREQELHRAELEITRRVEALELRVTAVQEELSRERGAREAAERELEALRAAQTMLQPLVGDLKQLAQRLRLAAEEAPAPPAPAAPPASAAEAAGAPSAPVPAAEVPSPPVAPPAPAAENPPAPPAPAAEQPSAPPTPRAPTPKAHPESSGTAMADALAAAVQRLRARVAAVGDQSEEEPGDRRSEDEPHDPQPEEQAPRGVPYTPPLAVGVPEPRAWLAPAIRRVAQRRDPRLAAELVLELLPVQALSVPGTLRYVARIAELGSYEVLLSGGHGTVRDLAGAASAESAEFVLEGSAAAFAELAAGGLKLSRWRPPTGLRIRAGRRRAGRLFSASRAPLGLADLGRAGITVWPGLLLLALAEAIDPAAVASHSFTIAFAIEGPQSAVLHLQARGGQPLAVSRAGDPSAPAGEAAPSETHPQTTVHLSEQAFARMIGGQDLAGESVLLEGDPAPLALLLSWTDRVQSIRRLAA
jgi:hypothetical protein